MVKYPVHLFGIFESDGGICDPRMLLKEDVDCLGFYMIADAVVGEYEVLKRGEWMIWRSVRNLG